MNAHQATLKFVFKFRSSLTIIFIACLYPSNFLHSLTYEEILQLVICDTEVLESLGIKILHNGKENFVKDSVSMIVGYNLESQAVGGFYSSSRNRFCNKSVANTALGKTSVIETLTLRKRKL